MKFTIHKLKVYLWILVICQFLFLTLLFFMVLTSNFWSVLGWWYIPASIPAVWGVFHMRYNKWGVHPAPKVGNLLAISGPYAYMRHPMYFSVLAIALIAAVQVMTWASMIMFVLLVCTILLKIREEERLLIIKHPAYISYMSSVGMFSPWF